MHKLFTWILEHPKTVLLILLVLTAMAANQMRSIHIETDTDAMLPKDSEAYVNKQVLDEKFGSSDLVIIGIINKQEGVYNKHTLGLVQELTDWLGEQPLGRRQLLFGSSFPKPLLYNHR